MAESTDHNDATEGASERHELRLGSLINGLIALAVAVLFLVNDGGVIVVDGPVAGAVLLLIAGAALVVRTAVRLVGRR